jgi:hypothetical protein
MSNEGARGRDLRSSTRWDSTLRSGVSKVPRSTCLLCHWDPDYCCQSCSELKGGAILDLMHYLPLSRDETELMATKPFYTSLLPSRGFASYPPVRPV